MRGFMKTLDAIENTKRNYCGGLQVIKGVDHHEEDSLFMVATVEIM
jgi:hypothetical protein